MCKVDSVKVMWIVSSDLEGDVTNTLLASIWGVMSVGVVDELIQVLV